MGDELLASVTPMDMAQAAVGAKLIWAAIDVGLAVAVFAVLTKVPYVSKVVFEYDDVLDDQARRLRKGELSATAASTVTDALARVKAARLLGLMIVMATALLE